MGLAVNQNTSVTSMFEVYCTASELGSCQSNSCHAWGYEQLHKSKDSLKACFENVDIDNCYRNISCFTGWFHELLPVYLWKQCSQFRHPSDPDGRWLDQTDACYGTEPSCCWQKQVKWRLRKCWSGSYLTHLFGYAFYSGQAEFH